MSDVATAAPERPYKGLRPFEATAVDALLFFGRERERELIEANLIASRLTILYGESGVGKSSVLRAGVVQMLRQQARAGAGFVVALYSGWSEPDPIEGMVDATREAVAELLGHDPGRGTGTLAERLAWLSDLAGGDLYLVLDQVDEYFLYHGADGVPLLDELPAVVTEPGLRVNVLLGIREESLARLDVFKARIPALFANSLRLERLDREAARSAIVGPLEAWSQLAGATPVDIEPAVVDAILTSVTGTAGNGNGAVAGAAIAPPYLQVVMERLWDAERAAGSNTLRLVTLEALGGGRRIVSEHLDRALAGLDPAEQDTAAAMFSHLVTPSGAKVAYDVADLAGYAAVAESEAQRVADALVDERILRPVNGRTEGNRVEIFHDVLAAAAAEWRRRHDAERAIETERAEARRRHRRLLALAVAALVALALMTAVAVYAVAQQHEADSQRGVAASEARSAKAREDAASALYLLPTDPAHALKLAASAAAAEPSPRTEYVLRTALVESRQRAVFGTGKAAVRAGAFSSDGKLIAIGDAGGRVVVARRHGERLLVKNHTAGVNAIAFVGSDRFVATASDDGTAIVWDVAKHRAARTLRDGRAVTDLAVSSDGKLLVTGSAGGAVRVWTLPDGTLRRVIQFPSPVAHVSLDANAGRVLVNGGGHARLYDTASGAELASFDPRRTVTVAALKPDGRLVATGYPGKHAVVRLWTVGGALVTTFVGHKSGIVDLEFGPPDAVPPGGSLLVSADAVGGARIYNVAVRDSRQFISPLFGHTTTLTAAAFSPDGRLVVTASTDQTAVVSNVEGLTLMTLVGHTDSVTGTGMSRDKRYVLTWSKDGTARVWDWQPDPLVIPVGGLTPAPVAVAFDRSTRVTASIDARGVVHVESPGGPARRLTHPGGATAVAVSPDGTWVATGGQDAHVLVWPLSGGEPRRLALGRPVRALGFSADGRSIVAGGLGGRARVWDVGARLLREVDARGRTVTAAALDRNAREIALGDGSGLVTLWSTATGTLEHQLKGHKNDITALDFNPDGRLLVSASRDHDARIWDVHHGRRLHLLRRHTSEIRDVAFSPDGRWVVTTGPQRVGLWTTATGRPVVLLQTTQKPQFVAAAFAPNSRTIRTVDSAGTVGVYRCRVCGQIGALRQLAEERLRAPGSR